MHAAEPYAYRLHGYLVPSAGRRWWRMTPKGNKLQGPVSPMRIIFQCHLCADTSAAHAAHARRSSATCMPLEHRPCLSIARWDTACNASCRHSRLCSHKQAVTSQGYGAPGEQSADDVVAAAQSACSDFIDAALGSAAEGLELDTSVVHKLQDLASTPLEESFMVRIVA